MYARQSGIRDKDNHHAETRKEEPPGADSFRHTDGFGHRFQA